MFYRTLLHFPVLLLLLGILVRRESKRRHFGRLGQPADAATLQDRRQNHPSSEGDRIEDEGRATVCSEQRAPAMYSVGGGGDNSEGLRCGARCADTANASTTIVIKVKAMIFQRAQEEATRSR